MVPITVTYLGDLRCEAVHGPSGVRLITDAPVDNQGKGESFSPTDLLATAYATCMTTIMGIVAKRDGIALQGVQIAVEKHMTAAPPRKVARIVLRFAMPAALTPDQRAKLEKAAHSCPVALSVSPDVTIEASFAYA
ncbi:MAG: OsmC family protein [Planctomycetes bacterium]|nr:OsmC family protein [Planctomycetota bacterium]